MSAVDTVILSSPHVGEVGAGLMPQREELLPFFVYGTLMSGYKNNKAVIRGRETQRVPAFIREGRLFHLMGFPGLIMDNTKPETNTRVVGEIVWGPADPAEYAALMVDLDALEEYYGPGDTRNVYDRRKITAYYTDAATGEVKSITAWMYCYLLSPDGYTYLPDGDWRSYMSREGKVDKADDWKEVLDRIHTMTAVTQ